MEMIVFVCIFFFARLVAFWKLFHYLFVMLI